MKRQESKFTLKFLGINTYDEPVIFLREDCPICKSEGFEAHSRVKVFLNGYCLIATVNTIQSELLEPHEASLSTHAWHFLKAIPGDEIRIAHPEPLDSISFIRSKLYNNDLKYHEIQQIIQDLNAGLLSDIDITMFLSASAALGLNHKETLDLTRAMVNTGEKLTWPDELVVDKHCVGGLPGNRTTLIIVPIVAAFGLMIPKTSSRAITSPAGTADTMEVFAPINLDLNAMRQVVEKEKGCIVWGGSVSLSPADDLLIHVERTMGVDSEGQLVASILSKKIAAGSNHLVIDIPVGPTAKVRTLKQANLLKNILEQIAQVFALKTTVVITDGTQPIGRGIGPALEARDVLSVLCNDKDAPLNLRTRALMLAGHLLEFSPAIKSGEGLKTATSILDSGQALNKFEAICRAQGGFFDIPNSKYQHTVEATQAGIIVSIDNRQIARLAKFAGAPYDKSAGVELLTPVGTVITKKQPLLIIHAKSKGELIYALSFLSQGHPIFQIEKPS